MLAVYHILIISSGILVADELAFERYGLFVMPGSARSYQKGSHLDDTEVSTAVVINWPPVYVVALKRRVGWYKGERHDGNISEEFMSLWFQGLRVVDASASPSGGWKEMGH